MHQLKMIRHASTLTLVVKGSQGEPVEFVAQAGFGDTPPRDGGQGYQAI